MVAVNTAIGVTLVEGGPRGATAQLIFFPN
jgi:hypothetical protein